MELLSKLRAHLLGVSLPCARVEHVVNHAGFELHVNGFDANTYVVVKTHFEVMYAADVTAYDSYVLVSHHSALFFKHFPFEAFGAFSALASRPVFTAEQFRIRDVVLCRRYGAGTVYQISDKLGVKFEMMKHKVLLPYSQVLYHCDPL